MANDYLYAEQSDQARLRGLAKAKELKEKLENGSILIMDKKVVCDLLDIIINELEVGKE